jgi:hypothetical protein
LVPPAVRPFPPLHCYMSRWSGTDDRHRKFPWGLSHLFLIINVLAMLSCSFGVISKKYPDYSVFGLLGVVVAQGQPFPHLIWSKLMIGLGYGLLFDLSFFLRNLSVVGGLLMVLSDSLQNKKKLFAGIPSLSETDRRK